MYNTCAKAMATEKASRFRTMQRAEKNIGERQPDMPLACHRLRPEAIDEELLDAESGFEMLKHAPVKRHHP